MLEDVQLATAELTIIDSSDLWPKVEAAVSSRGITTTLEPADVSSYLINLESYGYNRRNFSMIKWATSWENLFCHMRKTKAQISLRIRTVLSTPLLFAA